MYPRIHTKPIFTFSYDRLDMLWERYPQFHKMETFSTLDDLLTEHESYQADFKYLREEYVLRQYDRFLVQLSWADLPYRYETRKIIENADLPEDNPYITAFMEQFADLDTEHKACFLFPESYVSQFFVIMEVCQRAEILRPVRPLFPDEEKVHVSKSPLDGIVLRSPYLPDRIAKYQGNLPFYHNPAKTVFVRRNIDHILESGYFQSELEFFLGLTKVIMPFFHWWYEDLALYEEKDGYKTDWRMQRTKIRTELTAKGVIKPKWKHELTLFQEVHKLYPDVLYQYRPEWLGRQSLDMFIPSLHIAIEYQGIQHYLPVSFFGGEEALEQRKQLDEQKRTLCAQNDVALIEWPYDLEPTRQHICKTLKAHSEGAQEGFREVHLAIDKGNPQSEHFWKKNGFSIVREVTNENHTLLYAVRDLKEQEIVK